MNDKEIKTGELKLDPEFELLVKPVSDKKKQQIKSMLCLTKKAEIHAWNGFVVIDSLQYSICCDNNIPYEIIELSLPNRNIVISYICSNELERDDLNDEFRHFLMGQQHIALNQAKGKFRLLSKETSNFLSEKYEISIPTIYKYHKFAKAITHIHYDSPELAKSIINGDIKISHDNLLYLSMLDRKTLLVLTDALRGKKNYHLKKSEIKTIIHGKDDIPLPGIETEQSNEIETGNPQEQYSLLRDKIKEVIPKWTELLTKYKTLFCMNKIYTEEEALVSSQLSQLDDTLLKLRRTMEVAENE